MVSELCFLDAVINGQFGEAPRLPETTTTCREVAEWYAAAFAQRRSLLTGLTAADLGRQVEFLDLRRDPAVSFLNFAIRHSIHHRGQLSTYLSGMGAKVPAIHVESGDELYPPGDGSEPAEPPPCF